MTHSLARPAAWPRVSALAESSYEADSSGKLLSAEQPAAQIVVVAPKRETTMSLAMVFMPKDHRKPRATLERAKTSHFAMSRLCERWIEEGPRRIDSRVFRVEWTNVDTTSTTVDIVQRNVRSRFMMANVSAIVICTCSCPIDRT